MLLKPMFVAFTLIFAFQVQAAVKWNNPSKIKVVEKTMKEVESCTDLGAVEQYKVFGKDFSYSLKDTKKQLAEKVSKRGGDTMVLDELLYTGSNLTSARSLKAYAFKCAK